MQQHDRRGKPRRLSGQRPAQMQLAISPVKKFAAQRDLAARDTISARGARWRGFADRSALIDLEQMTIRVPGEQKGRIPANTPCARHLLCFGRLQNRRTGGLHASIHRLDVVRLDHEDGITGIQSRRSFWQRARTTVLEQPDHADPRMLAFHDQKAARRTEGRLGRQAIGSDLAVVLQPNLETENIAIKTS